MVRSGTLGLPGLYQALPEHIQQKVDQLGGVVSYAPEQLIQSRGDKTRGFSIIKAGAVRFGKLDAEGRFIAAAVFEPGQCYGEFTLFADLPRTHDGFAVGATRIQHISKAAFDELLAAEPALSAVLLSSLTKQLHNTLEWIDDMRRYPLKVYLGKRLLQLAQDAQGTIQITQTNLAEMLGVSRVAVGKVLGDYEQRGFIKRHYGYLELVAPDALRRWLRRYIHLEAMPVS